MEGYYIVKSILHEILPVERVLFKDKHSFFNVLFDGKNTKPLCRFYFNNPSNKKIGLFDKGGGNAGEEKIAIIAINDLYQYADRIKATVPFYLQS